MALARASLALEACSSAKRTLKQKESDKWRVSMSVGRHALIGNTLSKSGLEMFVNIRSELWENGQILGSDLVSSSFRSNSNKRGKSVKCSSRATPVQGI